MRAAMARASLASTNSSSGGTPCLLSESVDDVVSQDLPVISDVLGLMDEELALRQVPLGVALLVRRSAGAVGADRCRRRGQVLEAVAVAGRGERLSQVPGRLEDQGRPFPPG